MGLSRLGVLVAHLGVCFVLTRADRSVSPVEASVKGLVAEACCTDDNAECGACQAGVDVASFCSQKQNSGKAGCGRRLKELKPSVIQAPQQAVSVKGLDAVPCCKADTAECGACVAGVDVKTFCAQSQNSGKIGCSGRRLDLRGVIQAPKQEEKVHGLVAAPCCTDEIAECWACQAGLDVQTFCAQSHNSGKPGCGERRLKSVMAPVIVVQQQQSQEAVQCCRAYTAQCLACAAMMDVAIFCAVPENANIPGCSSRRAEAIPSEVALKPAEGDVQACCNAMTAACEACHAGLTLEEYCSKNPSSTGCEEVKKVDDKVCCDAMNAMCESCHMGITIEEFCEKFPGKDGCAPKELAAPPALVIGSPPLAGAAGSEPEVACAGFGDYKVGEQVISERGHASVACAFETSPAIVGVCGAARTGHNNYFGCKGKKEQPSFCGDHALFFVRCGSLSRDVPAAPQIVAPPQPPPIETPQIGEEQTDDDNFKLQQLQAGSHHPCGCSWSAQHGCGVSTEQIIALMDNPQLLESCGPESAGEEACAVRRQVVSVGSEIRKCLGLDPRECAEVPLCQWGAQAQGQCGVDEEQVVLQLIGHEHQSNPFVKLLMMHDRCSKHTEEWCDADTSCSWRPGMPQAVCDLKPAVVIKYLVSYPRLALDIRESSQHTFCLLRGEVGGQQACVPPCHMESSGLCVPNEETNVDGHAAFQELLAALCQTSMTSAMWGKSPTCPEPCQLVSGQCQPPSSDLWRDAATDVPLDSKSVIRVTATLGLLTGPYTAQCITHDATMCQVSQPVCGAAGAVGGVHPDFQTGTISGLGIKGLLQKAAKAISDGKGSEFVSDYIHNNPESLEDLASRAVDSFKSLLDRRKPQAGSGAATETGFQKPPHEHVGPTVVQADSPPQDVVSDAPPGAASTPALAPENVTLTEYVTHNPYAFSFLLLVVSAACFGIAFGALCHAKLLQVQVREPLLQGETPYRIREQEMEETHRSPGSHLMRSP